jgi:CcmD family protein
MKLFRACLVVLLLVSAAWETTVIAQQPPPQQQDEFIPIEKLGPQDQLPAAPLLVAAYSFVALALFAYVVSVARRLGSVQRELDRLEAELKHTGRT